MIYLNEFFVYTLHFSSVLTVLTNKPKMYYHYIL
jgi:hypothetical protein